MLKQIVYIASSPYSGSTLLDILLGMQKNCLSLGEVHRLGMQPEERMKSFGNRCSCEERLDDCEHWQNIKSTMSTAAGMSKESDWSDWGITLKAAHKPNLKAKAAAAVYSISLALNAEYQAKIWRLPIFREYRQVAKRSYFFSEHIASASEHETLIDSTKTALRLYSLWQDKPQQIKVIHLVRDGRGIAYSRMKRSGDTIAKATKFWQRRIMPINKTLNAIADEQKLLIKYEDLCAEPVQCVKEICRFLNTDFDPSRVCLANAKHHMIPGNPMSSRKDSDIKLDEQWKTQLTPSELEYFSKHGAKLNTNFGYQ